MYRARSGAVWGGMSYRHFIFCKINIPELLCLETPYRYELFECFKSHNLYYCWNNTTQNNRVIDYFHQQHCLVYITIALSCKWYCGQGQGSAWWYFHSRCTYLHQADRCILHLFSALLHGGGSETSLSVSAKVLFTGPSVHVHPRRVPRRVVPVHLHHVQCFPATRSAPWMTEGSHRHANLQETRSRSGPVIQGRQQSVTFKRLSIRTEIRRAAGISIGTAPLHLVYYLGCHLYCRITWRRSSLLCRWQPTLPPLPSAVDQSTAALRLAECIKRVEGWMKSNRLKLNFNKTQFLWLGSRQQFSEDRHKDHDDQWTLHRIFDFRQESWRDNRQWTGDGWTCMSTTSLTAVSIKWDSWDPSDDHFPRIPRKHWSLPSYQVGSNIATVSFTVPLSVVVRRLQSVLNAAARLISNRRKFDHITPVLRDQLPLASHPSAYRLQDCGLCLQRPPRSRSDIPQLHLKSGPGGWRQGSPAFCLSRRPDRNTNQDPSFRAQKLPCLRTGCLELTARGHSNSGTVTGTFQIYVEKHIYFAKHMPSSAHSAFVT